MTLGAQNEDAKFYFHTNSQIQSEAFILAKHWSKEPKNKYIIYGLGMGYHILELLNISLNSEIEIYEGDRNVIQLACAFSDISKLIGEDRIKIIYDPTYQELIRRLDNKDEDEGFFIHYPSYENIRVSAAKSILNKEIGWAEAINAL